MYSCKHINTVAFGVWLYGCMAVQLYTYYATVIWATGSELQIIIQTAEYLQSPAVITK